MSEEGFAIAGGSRPLQLGDADQGAHEIENLEDDVLSWSSAECLLGSSPRTFFCTPFGGKLAVEYFNGYQVSDKAKTLVESGSDERPEIRSRHENYPFTHFWNWVMKNQRYLGRLFSTGRNSALDSQCVILLGTTGFQSLLEIENGRQGHDEVMELFFGQAVGTTAVITLFTTGIVGNFEDLDERPNAVELENPVLPCISGLEIPEVYGMQIKSFCITEGEIQACMGKLEIQNLEDLLGITQERIGHLQGVVIFMKDSEIPENNFVAAKLLSFIMRYTHVSLIGGATPFLGSRGTSDRLVFAAGLLIFGDKAHVQVGCTSFEQPGISTQNIAKMTKLRKVLMEPRNQDEAESSFGLMIGSHERGLKMYDGAPGVDTGFFNCIFPQTTLIGGFLKVQYCSDRVHSEEEWDFQVKDGAVFMLVSYRHPHPF